MTETEIKAAIGTKQPKVLGTMNGIRIINATAGDVVTVYAADGRQLRKQRLNAAQTDMTLDGGALYIVKVGSKVVKVRL